MSAEVAAAREADYSRTLNRMLYDSPLHTTKGKVVFAIIIAVILYPSLHTWMKWLTPLETGWVVFAGIALAFLGSWVALVFLRYLDRRQPESWWYYVGVLALATFFTTAPAAFINHYSPMPLLTVGFSEEFWKVVPLLLIVFFAPTLVTGVRDGIIYGALGGIAFNLTEIGDYILRVSFHEGVDGFIFQLGRLGYGGIQNHAIWSMLVGAGIGMAVQTENRRTRILAPLGAYLFASLTHDFQDFLGAAILGTAATLIVLVLQGVDPSSLSKAKAKELAQQNMATTIRIEIVLVNLIVIPVLLWLLAKSGTWERTVIRDELADEVEPVITAEEYEGVKAEKRFRLRKVPGYPGKTARAIRSAQNNLAFTKLYLKKRNRPIEGDPLVGYYRCEVARLRDAAAA